jgi:hypothetical protein
MILCVFLSLHVSWLYPVANILVVPETHTKRQATRHGCLPSLLTHWGKCMKVVCGEEKNICAESPFTSVSNSQQGPPLSSLSGWFPQLFSWDSLLFLSVFPISAYQSLLYRKYSILKEALNFLLSSLLAPPPPHL